VDIDTVGFIAGYSAGYISFTTIVTAVTAIHGTINPFTASVMTAIVTITGATLKKSL
jgi:hypothetical protein